MSRDSYMAALLAMGMREHQSAQWPVYLQQQKLATPGPYVRPAWPFDVAQRSPVGGAEKVDKAIAYLRERKLYCLDRQQPRIPPQARPQTLLDKWMKERHK